MKQCTELNKKVFLNEKETIALYNLSARKFKRLISTDQPFIARYNKRRLIIRTEFEKYLKTPGIMEALEKEWESRKVRQRRLENNGK